jgi:hypothetical protein
VTWISLSERIIHAARMVVDRLDLVVDDPQRERQEAPLRKRSRFAWKLVVEEVKERGFSRIAIACSRRGCGRS